MEYVSTNVRLPKPLLKNLKLKAVEEEKSMGEVLREALARGLNTSPDTDKPSGRKRMAPPPRRKHPLCKIIGLGASGVTDGGTNHDKYLYGLSKNQWKK